MNFGGAMPGGGDFAYSGLSMQGIKDGKIAAMKVDEARHSRSDTQPAGGKSHRQSRKPRLL